MKLIKFGIATLMMGVILISCSNATHVEKKETTIDQVYRILPDSSNVVLLDVRTNAEFNGELGHLPGAILIPIQELEQRIGELDSLKGREIIVYCRSGNRSGKVTEILTKHGFNARNMLGGMIAWNEKYGKPDADKIEK